MMHTPDCHLQTETVRRRVRRCGEPSCGRYLSKLLERDDEPDTDPAHRHGVHQIGSRSPSDTQSIKMLLGHNKVYPGTRMFIR